MKVVAFIVATLLCFVGMARSQPPIVKTPYGAVSGTVENGIFVFKGIPFAAPPERFADPQEPQPWPGVLDATKFSAGCIAPCLPYIEVRPDVMCAKSISEDCLYMNIYTPSVNSTSALPVIAYLFGGGFQVGSAGLTMYDATDFALKQNVVIVTFNFRVGLLGGLYTGTVRGNYGQKDQRQALKFIQKTISAFGGNPQLVTLSGLSSGAQAVITHMASPRSWPYFQRAVIISDPWVTQAASPTEAIQLGIEVLSRLNCPVGGDAELACLRNASANDMLTVQGQVGYLPWPHKLMRMTQLWVPVVDGDELPYQPFEALSTQKFNKVPVYVGTAADEALAFVHQIPDLLLSQFGYQLILELLYGAENGKKIAALYGDIPKGSEYPHMSKIVTDFLFYCPTRYIASHLTKATPTYVYYFGYVGSYMPWVYGLVQQYCGYAACHACDIGVFFNSFEAMQKIDPTVPMPTKIDLDVAFFYQKAIANFARTGAPNPLPNGISFQPFDPLVNRLVNISAPPSVIYGFHDEYCDLWDTIGYTNF